MGRATATAINVVRSVPVIKGRIPKCFSAYKGVHLVSVRKSMIETSLKKEKDSANRTQMIPMVVKIAAISA